MWQDEEEPQWGADDSEETKPAAAADGGAAPAEGGAPPAEGEAAPVEGQAAEDAPKKRNPDRPLYNRHWVRPRFLQYSYLYDYRKNYYDDVIDFLDRRSHGIIREVPRPQTWAERALRTYTQKLGATQNAIKAKTDEELIHSLHHSRAIHHYHAKDYYTRKLTITY